MPHEREATLHMPNSVAQLPSEFDYGMYVRFPDDAESDTDFRSFRIGQLINWNPFSAIATIRLQYEVVGLSGRLVETEQPIEHLERCMILPDSPMVHVETERPGRLLCACRDELVPGELLDYFVHIDGAVRRIPENEIQVSSTCQAVNPVGQLRRYEFHNPVWMDSRDELVESIYELQSSTFGIEDLVGSRVLLLPHQAAVITRVLSAPVCRFVLADEVGLGKTIEAAVILKSLLRRHPAMRTLVIVPAALKRQWRQELRDKFWLSLECTDDEIDDQAGGKRTVGQLVTVEELLSEPRMVDDTLNEDWDLLILDEAHHLRRWPDLHQQLCRVSERSERALILSATPIQRRAREYLMLLRLMDPARYLSLNDELFDHLVEAQDEIRRTAAYLTEILDPELFDPHEFYEELDRLSTLLPDDPQIKTYATELIASKVVSPASRSIAQSALTYVGENYRIEQRVFRNRRAHVNAELPEREFDPEYAYSPSERERIVLGSLAQYCMQVQKVHRSPIANEYCRICLHAAMSSPHALHTVLQHRRAILEDADHSDNDYSTVAGELTSPGAPREESERIAQVIRQASAGVDEHSVLRGLFWETEQWLAATESHLEALLADRRKVMRTSEHRLHHVLLAIELERRDNDQPRILLFTSWPQTLDVLVPSLRSLFGTSSVAEFRVGMSDDDLYESATRFQSDPSCWILVADELGGEGRNFQAATTIIHVDLPWTPALIEQRIGRVDRLGRSGVVRSIVPYAIDSLEHDLFRIWQDGFQLFSRSMSGLEIALEGIQDELLEALSSDFADGLARLAPVMAERAHSIRESVEEERFFEEIVIDRDFESAFEAISDKYRDGKVLRRSILGWGDLAGLRTDYEPNEDVVIFVPTEFNGRSMANARFIPPSMEDELVYMQRVHDRVLRGTFNRDVAIRRENLIFYAPGSDPWTDAVIANAIEADRGRCRAVRRCDPDIEAEWTGFELLYRILVNPQPLYEAGLDPIHLLRAHGKLQIPVDRVVISSDGEILARNSPIRRILRKEYRKNRDEHLGQRSGSPPPIAEFRAEYPRDRWFGLIDELVPRATNHIAEEFDFVRDLASDAVEEFSLQAAGWRAGQEWLTQQTGTSMDSSDIETYERASHALVEGLRNPIFQLESATFWDLRPAQR